MGGRRKVEHVPLVRHETECNLSMCQCTKCDDVFDVRHFGLPGPEKLAPGRQIEKQVPDFDDCSFGGSDIVHRHNSSTGHLNRRAAECAAFPRRQRKPRHCRDAGDGFTPKTERMDVIQVFGTGNLARGVAFQCQQRVIAAHPAAVVRHLHARSAAVLDDNGDVLRPGVE